MNLINTRESGSNKYLNIKKKFSHDWLGIFLPILSLWSKYIYVYVWLVSLHCSPETVTALLIIYNLIQNKKLKKKGLFTMKNNFLNSLERYGLFK